MRFDQVLTFGTHVAFILGGLHLYLSHFEQFFLSHFCFGNTGGGHSRMPFQWEKMSVPVHICLDSFVVMQRYMALSSLLCM